MAGDLITIERVLEPTSDHVEALKRLLPQLSGATPPSLAELKLVTSNPATYLFFARHSDLLVASLSLITFATPTGVRAWIEDVVVDSPFRAKGVASMLVTHAVSQAKLLGAVHVDLTSRQERVEANRLYRRLGFLARETNVYRLNL
ncbi:MAG TPA: GNAT family N-acetyltransferase [Acidimicrobiales bacterium]|nr:GNAT family N-acetyltransferase [Acidimicrobiales bacterium]